MTPRVDVKPELLRWARERARLAPTVLVRRFPKHPRVGGGHGAADLKQLEAFARTSRAPVGYLFLPEPPIEGGPIPDLRTVRDSAIGRSSPEMLDTVHLYPNCRASFCHVQARETLARPLLEATVADDRSLNSC